MSNVYFLAVQKFDAVWQVAWVQKGKEEVGD